MSVAHTAIALAAQIAVGLASGDFVLGGAIGAAFYAGREVTQAEYRWIEHLGADRRANMPWWGPFDARVWTVKSVLDFAAPTLAVLALALVLK